VEQKPAGCRRICLRMVFHCAGSNPDGLTKSAISLQLDFSNLVELPRTKPTLALESCADFFDRDYDSLMVEVENQVIKFAWDIQTSSGVMVAGATSNGRPQRREIRIYAASAWAFCYQKPMPAVSEDQIYKLILPGRDIRSTELQRILACSHQHVHELKRYFVITREPRQADGPNSFTVFSRASIEGFLRSRRLS
jgi:hypothetical protein